MFFHHALGCAILLLLFFAKKYVSPEEEKDGHELGLTNDFGRGGIDDLPEVTSIQAEMKSQDLPWIPFDVILHATEHFSDANKLGQGGFGPVYKVIISGDIKNIPTQLMFSH